MEVKPTWETHALTQRGVVELVPTDWVLQYRGTDVTPQTNLKDGRLVSLAALWENIKSEGLHDPLIMRVGIENQKFRLEAGNHRVQVCSANGVTHIPVTVEVRAECGPHLTDRMNNGSHNFDFADEVIVANLKPGYQKPSAVFTSLCRSASAG